MKWLLHLSLNIDNCIKNRKEEISEIIYSTLYYDINYVEIYELEAKQKENGLESNFTAPVDTYIGMTKLKTSLIKNGKIEEEKFSHERMMHLNLRKGDSLNMSYVLSLCQS